MRRCGGRSRRCGTSFFASSNQTLPTNIAIATTTTTTPLNLLIDDTSDELPIPIGMTESISNAVEPPKQIWRVEL